MLRCASQGRDHPVPSDPAAVLADDYDREMASG
jgi:hypothetical protein